MNILAIETASDACSAAVLADGQIYQQYELAPRRHTGLILPMVEAVLTEAALILKEVDAIAFGCGPGAFTGLRIAAGVTQGLAFAADKPVIPISTLAALAQQIVETQSCDYVLAGLDARMQEVYWGCYVRQDNGLVAALCEDAVAKPEMLIVPKSKRQEEVWGGVGSAWQVYAEALSTRLSALNVSVSADKRFADLYPQARYIASLAAEAWQCGRVLTATEAQPVYLRNNVAKKKTQ